MLTGRIKLQKWADSNLLFWLIVWLVGGYIFVSLYTPPGIVVAFLLGVTVWYHQYRGQAIKIKSLQAHLGQISAGLRDCDVCSFPTETLPELLMSSDPIICKACSDLHCHDGSIPPHIALAAQEHRQQVLANLGLPFFGKSSGTCLGKHADINRASDHGLRGESEKQYRFRKMKVPRVLLDSGFDVPPNPAEEYGMPNDTPYSEMLQMMESEIKGWKLLSVFPLEKESDTEQVSVLVLMERLYSMAAEDEENCWPTRTLEWRSKDS